MAEGTSVSAHHGALAAGYIGRVEQYAAPRAPVSWPHRSGSVLPRRADCFQHRAAFDVLSEVAVDGGPVALCQVLAGAGGMGKTQLAAHHARTAWQAGQLDLLVWVPASSRDAIIGTYAQSGAEVAGAPADDPARAAERFLHWAETTDRRWMIVLDDIIDPADLHGLWPPAHPRGRTIITTRRRDAALTAPGRHRIDVGTFTSEEAASYLTATLATHGRTDDPTQIISLAADLGHLPLALAQAAAYLIDLDLDCATYRARLADRAHTLRDLLPEPGGLPDDHRATVAATWSLSIEQANRLRPRGLARPLLNLTSMLDPNGIPAAVLTSQPGLTYLTTHRTTDDTALPTTAEATIAALRCLHRLSLADHTPGISQRTVRIHGLVQRVTRDTLPTNEQTYLARAAADALLAVWPDNERDIELARALRSNTEALIRHAEDALYQPDVHEVLFRLGESLVRSGQHIAATSHFQHLAHTIRTDLDPNRPVALSIRYNLAHCQGEAGDPAGAAEVYASLLSDTVRALGPDHPYTLITRFALIWWQGITGDAADAVAAFAALLPDQARMLGPDHPDTLVTRTALTWWRGVAGDTADAARDYADLLPDLVRVLGPGHPHTLLARTALAWWRGVTGDPVGAAVDNADLLPDLMRVLGTEHPDTLLARGALAWWRGVAGDTADAARDLADLLPVLVRVVGPDHPNTLLVQLGHAWCQGAAKGTAACDLIGLLPDLVRVLGPDHPGALIIQDVIAPGREGRLDAADAVAAWVGALVSVMSPVFPSMISFQRTLASFRRSERTDNGIRNRAHQVKRKT